MAKKTRRPEPQTPSLALSPSNAKHSPSAEPLAVEANTPALPNADRMAREIYRVALEQKDAVTLLRLAQALYPEKFKGSPVPPEATA